MAHRAGAETPLTTTAHAARDQRVPALLAVLALLTALLALPPLAPTAPSAPSAQAAPADALTAGAAGRTAHDARDDRGRYVVRAGVALPVGARILARLPVAGALLVSSPVVPAGAVPAGTPLGRWKLLAAPDGASDGGPRLDSGVASTGAPAVWDRTRGERAVVALVDTGIAPVPALEGAIAGEIDFSGTGGGDPYGHGTFLASLIAGRGEVATGVAPGTGLLSLKVGAPDGSTDLGTVLGALQWLYGPGRAAGIRIATLALGVDPADPGAELLDHATRTLADRGVLVIAAAGNEGRGALTSPATSTGSFSVGAVDDHGTADRTDDTLAPFSGDGPDRAGVAQPDAVASGVGVVGSIPAGSEIARANPQAVVEERWFRGSGTSMATALVAGVAALVSSARPDLDGAALDVALRAGGGAIDAPAALAAADGMPPSPDGPADPPPGKEHGKDDDRGHGKGEDGDGEDERGDGTENGNRGKGEDEGEHGTENGNRGEDEDEDGDGGHDGEDGEEGAEGTPQAVRWTTVRWTAVRWTAVRWTAVRWTAVRWTAVRWTLQPGAGDPATATAGHAAS